MNLRIVISPSQPSSALSQMTYALSQEMRTNKTEPILETFFDYVYGSLKRLHLFESMIASA